MHVALPHLDALFVHIPKTGGSWVSEVLRQSSLATEPGGASVAHGLNYTERGFRFCFVRHPLAWYESAWRALRKRRTPAAAPPDPLWTHPRWQPLRVLTACCDRTDFNAFIESILTREAGLVTRMYEWYIGPPGLPHVEFVGRTEQLAKHLSEALALRGHTGELPAVGRVNQSDGERPRWDASLWERVLASEAAGINRWYRHAMPSADIA